MLYVLLLLSLPSMATFFQAPVEPCSTVVIPGDDVKYISGDPLKDVPGENNPTKDKQRAGAEAAIALILEMEGDGGCEILSPQEFEFPASTNGGPPRLPASLQLDSLLQDGRLCVDTSHPDIQPGFKAFSARPDGHDVTPYVGSGYPAINVTPANFPSCDPETGELDSGQVAKLASILLHELYHTAFPGEADSTTGEREGPAFTYQGAMLIQMLCCDGITTDQAAGLCEILNAPASEGGINATLAFLDLPQFSTEKCDEEGAGLNSNQGSTFFPMAESISLGYFATVPAGIASGSIKVNFALRTVIFDINGAMNLHHTVELANEAAPELQNFQPVSADYDASAPSPKALFLFGYDSVSLSGQVVKISFDAANGGEFLVSHIIYSSAFDNPIDVWVSPFGGNKALVINHGSQTTFLLVSLLSGQSTILLDANTDARMYTSKYIRWIHLTSPDLVTGEKSLRVAIGATKSPDFSLEMQEVSFYDDDLDGQFDRIE